MQLKLIRTDDGSLTAFDRDLGATYRSTKGAISESRAVFVDAAQLAPGGHWIVWELGFGLGTNFGQLWKAAASLGATVDYHAVERSLVPADMLMADIAMPLARKALEQAGNLRRAGDDRGTLTLYIDDWRSLAVQDVSAHAVFHDPFGPEVDPQCWTKECFTWQRQHLSPDGRLLTYSCAGHVRRAMEQAGLVPRKVPGPPGKREVTVATLEGHV